MPALEVGVDPRGNGGQKFIERAGEGVGTQRGRDESADNASIEGIAGQAEAAVAKKILRGAATSADTGTDVNQREVAGAAAEVADKDEFVVIEGGLVSIGSGDGLHLEIDRLEACMDECLAEALEGEGVIVGSIGSYKADWTAYGGVTNGLAKLLLGLQAQVGEDARDQVFERVAAAEDLGSGERTAGEVRLKGLNKATLVLGLEIVLDSGGPSEAFDLGSTRMFVLLQIKDGAEGFGDRRGSRKRDEFDHAFGTSEGNGTVRCAEVDADGETMGGGKRHGLSECQIFALGDTALEGDCLMTEDIECGGVLG